MLVRIISFIISLFFITEVLAAMTIGGTRIIFPGNQKEQSVRMNNKGKKPALVQVWIDDGDLKADLNTVNLPFVITPPVFRVEPGKGQSVRLIYNGAALPADRESVFWFNMLEVPPLHKEMANVDRLELAFRTRIKLFYRPASLLSSGTAQVEKVQWELAENKGINVTNPTAYYLSFDSAALQNATRVSELETDMIAPFSRKFFPLKKGTISGVTGASFRLINDYGSAYEGKLIPKNGKELVLQGSFR